MAPELKLNTEYPEPDEQETIEKLIVLLRGVIEGRYLTGVTTRDVHVKGHAAVRAEVTVEPGLPPELRVGVFKEPRTYPAWVRFSNSGEVPSKDIKGDIRGFALKLMGVEGQKLIDPAQEMTTHDFIFLSTPVFLNKGAKDFCELVETGALNEKKTLGNRLAIARYFFIDHREVGAVLRKASRKFPNLLEIEWFSATPYMFGERAVKYVLKPHRPPTSELPKRPDQNFLRERLVADLAREGAGFDFYVQPQTDPYKEPVENALVPWESPLYKVATVNIPRQEVGWPERMQVPENFSFNPWRCLPEHRPLGSANRARKAVYLAISNFRRTRNGVPTTEPTPD
jgi:hypothetical protein